MERAHKVPAWDGPFGKAAEPGGPIEFVTRYRN